jgi:serine phosphatase RsbU (regulator of sigma subunit)
MQWKEWGVLVFAAICGLYAVILFVIMHRHQFKLLPLVAALVAVAVYLSKWLPRGAQISVSPEAGHRIAFDAIGILVAMLLGLRFFVRFVNTQGVEQIRVRTELELAHEIQETLVPPITICTYAIETYGVSVPSKDVGGDLVDLIPADSGWLACVADVSGHGIPAGVLMGNLKTALRLGCDQGQPLPRMIEAVNRVLPAVKKPEMYATLACALFRDVGDAEYLVAGHPPILHYRAATAKIERCTMEQFPLGLMFLSGYTSASVHHEHGDLFVLLSDGILETTNSAGVEFGLEGVERALYEHAKLPLKEIASLLLAELERFGPRTDDQTLLLIRTLK